MSVKIMFMKREYKIFVTCLQAMQHLPADFCLQTNPKHTEVQCGKKLGFQS